MAFVRSSYVVPASGCRAFFRFSSFSQSCLTCKWNYIEFVFYSNHEGFPNRVFFLIYSLNQNYKQEGRSTIQALQLNNFSSQISVPRKSSSKCRKLGKVVCHQRIYSILTILTYYKAFLFVMLLREMSQFEITRLAFLTASGQYIYIQYSCLTYLFWEQIFLKAKMTNNSNI